MALEQRDREVLEARARRLARPVAAAPERVLELVVFELANEVYAVESRRVIAVFPLRDLTPLPGAEPVVVGVTTWRGELLTILDLRRALGISAAGLADMSKVVVLGELRPSFGVLADAVRGLVTLPLADVLAPQGGVAPHREFLRGVTRDAVVVLDGEALLRLVEPAPPISRGDRR